MVVTHEVNLPEFNQLTVEEVNLSTGTLISAAPYLGKTCESVNNEFMLCRREKDDPRACIDLGKKVTSCTLDFFKKLKRNCLQEFNQYAHCIDQSSGDYSFRYCRKTQAVLDECVAERMCVERPDFGYFCRARIHQSNSRPPAQSPCPCHPKVQDPTAFLPDCKPRPPARFGSRFYWLTE